jgi:AcrR family transcriptional regulator
MKKDPSATHHQRIQAAIQERREHERQELRQLILKAAGELFLEVGYEQFSVRKLAERIGYSATTVYLYFTDKDGLFSAVVDEGFSRFIEQLRSAAHRTDEPLQRLEQMERAYVQFGLHNPVYYRLMFLQRGDFLTRRSADQPQPRIEALEILPQAVQQAMDAQVIRPGNAQQVSDALWALLHGLVALAIEMPVFDEGRIARAASAVHELWLHGLLHA